MEQGQIVVRKRGAARIRAGHLWIYRSDIVDAAGVMPGAVVSVRDERGTVIGKAFYSSTSQIALRFLARSDVRIDLSFFKKRLSEADELRALHGVDPWLSRRVYSEGDLLPGYIVDRYGDYLVLQSLTQGADRLQPEFAALLQEQYAPRSIIIRNDNKIRELEGLPLSVSWIGEEPPETTVVDEDGRAVEVFLRAGQKTGSYLDQRDNHRAARRFARGRAMDAFSYAGGFALQIAIQCESVEAIDSSEDAVRLARANAARNGLANIECFEANVFDYLRDRFDQGHRYDTIILDPPPFARNRDSVEGALRGYKEINQRSMRLLKDGGVLVTCSCSHHISEGIFAETLAQAARDAGCWVTVLERRVQSPDHPILLTVPETLYLKCFILQVRY